MSNYPQIKTYLEAISKILDEMSTDDFRNLLEEINDVGGSTKYAMVERMILNKPIKPEESSEQE